MYRLWVRILDDDGDTSTMTVNIPGTFTLTEAQGFADDVLPLLDAITDGAIQEAGISVAVTLPGGLQANPVQYCDVQRGALFSWRTENNYNTTFRIPAFTPSKFATGSKNVDTGDADVTNFVTAIISGTDVGGTQVTPSDYRGDDITSLTSAVESFRK